MDKDQSWWMVRKQKDQDNWEPGAREGQEADGLLQLSYDTFP